MTHTARTTNAWNEPTDATTSAKESFPLHDVMLETIGAKGEGTQLRVQTGTREARARECESVKEMAAL